jgi:hypothetical protein
MVGLKEKVLLLLLAASLRILTAITVKRRQRPCTKGE